VASLRFVDSAGIYLDSRRDWPRSLVLSPDHSGVAAEIDALPASYVSGPGVATLKLVNLADLHRALDRVYRLAVSLPQAPLR
jgi:hypothetical protein